MKHFSWLFALVFSNVLAYRATILACWCEEPSERREAT